MLTSSHNPRYPPPRREWGRDTAGCPCPDIEGFGDVVNRATRASDQAQRSALDRSPCLLSSPPPRPTNIVTLVGRQATWRKATSWAEETQWLIDGHPTCAWGEMTVDHLGRRFVRGAFSPDCFTLLRSSLRSSGRSVHLPGACGLSRSDQRTSRLHGTALPLPASTILRLTSICRSQPWTPAAPPLRMAWAPSTTCPPTCRRRRAARCTA